MPSEQQVYQKHAGQYKRLVDLEDFQGNILHTVEHICPLSGQDVVDLGAGTGRMTRLLAPYVGTINAYDTSAHMLSMARSTLQVLGLENWQVGVADHRSIPQSDNSADLVISGWSFCYLAVWGGEQWRAALDAGYREISRVLRPGGRIIFLETLGTGLEAPNPPEHLVGYFNWLSDKGFQSAWIRTDYRFNSLAEAGQLASFFFGPELEREIITKNWIVLPECTGVWWQKL